MDQFDSAAAFGKVVRQRRRELRLSQDDLALAIGVSRKVVNEMEQGKPNLQLRIAIAAAQSVGLNLWADVRGHERA